ncbi:hypothetical protein B0T21DRAFT_381445 [Apiosordaria backusii]|uniref:Uncharacterized protein n=1 Tax=Apiosordaria backusii TaxID=314023 RepID=A0AA40ELM9_9PEZI|nr:hypothetical protein B0T21DRAFT_381445 [Apiosordaria backusii]
MVTNNSTSTPDHQGLRAYLPPAPQIDEKVVPAYWVHYCAVNGKEEWDLWRGGPHTCEHRCGYETSPATILRNSEGHKVETVGGENLLQDRFVDWWAICCQCQRWQENVLPAHTLYGRIPRAEGQNCCQHCRSLTTGMGDCHNCFVITKYREITRTMGGSNVPGGARDRHVRGVLARRQRELSDFHSIFNVAMKSTTSVMTKGMEDEKKEEKETKDKENKKEDEWAVEGN